MLCDEHVKENGFVMTIIEEQHRSIVGICERYKECSQKDNTLELKPTV